MNNVVTTPVSVRFSKELNTMLSTVVEENNTTKTDFIRQAVVEKIEDMYDIRMADQAHKEWVDGGEKPFLMKK